MHSSRRIATKAIHAGEPEPRIFGSVTVPIFQSAMFETAGGEGYHDIKYIRLNNTPNHQALHAKLAALENAEAALVAASGMAAISSALLAVLSVGDHLLIQDSLYGGTHDFVTHDLPEDSQGSLPQRRRRPKRFTGVAFGSVERRGRWRVPRFAGLAVLFGDADIDLRTAEIHSGTITINALLLFGNADFYVPRSVEVDLGGLTIFGHRREHGDDSDPAPQAPLVRIRVWSLFGTSDVWRIPSGMSGTYRELIRSIRKRRQLDPG